MSLSYSLRHSHGHQRVFFVLIGSVVALSLVASSLFSLIAPQASEALSGSSFKAGRIIDDGVFFNGNSMPASLIQTFLNSKVPACDTYGNQMRGSQTRAQYGTSAGNPPPYVCLRDYQQNTPAMNAESGLCIGIGGGVKTSAQIIRDVSVACGINPQVLLVLLQKEQSLITDDWPWQNQYNKATGFGCPDTAPCNPNYGGFFYQVYYAARQFKKYARDANTYGYKAFRNNNILYNPVGSCGSSSVFIENQSTAGLYIYTPYQPNQAALNNLYGTGDSCSSYGNRNFWRMFNDWFGSTYGSLIRTASSGDLFYTDGTRRFVVPSMEVIAQYGFGINDVRFVSQQEMNDTPLAVSPYTTTLGQVVKSESDGDEDGGAIYIIDSGTRIAIESMEQFTNYGLTGASISYLPLNSIKRLPLRSANLSNFVQTPDQSIYKIEAGKKRVLFEIPKLQQQNPSGNITQLSWQTLTRWQFGTPLVDNDYVIIGSDGGVRLYRDNGFYSVSSMDVYGCWGLNKIKTFRVSSYGMTNGTSSGALSNCLARNSGGTHYLMGGSKKYQLPDGQNVTPFQLSDAIINGASTTALTPVAKGSGSELSVLESNKKRPIMSMGIYSGLGYGSNDITTLPQAAYNSLPRGAAKFIPGSLLLEPSGGISVVASDTTRFSIVSPNQFNHFGYNWGSLYRISNTDLAAYTSAGNLPYYLKNGSNLYLIDGRVRYLIPSAIDDELGLDRDSIPSVSTALFAPTTLPWTMTKFIKSNNSNAVYMLDAGKKRPLASWQAYLRESNNRPQDLVILTPDAVARFQTGTIVP